MALFDPIIRGTAEKFDLGEDRAGTLLAALLALMTDGATGGMKGFLERFERAGLGSTAASWITTGDNAGISDAEFEQALGEGTVGVISGQVGIGREKTVPALAHMTPAVVDLLTPDGRLPDDESLLSRIGGFLTGSANGVPAGSAAAEEAAAAADERMAAVFRRDGDGAAVIYWMLPLLLLLGIVVAAGAYLA